MATSPARQQADLDALTSTETALANEAALNAKADAALAANDNAIAAITAWLTTGPGAGTANLTAAQMSQALRSTAQYQVTQFREYSALIRLLRRKLDSASGT